MIHVLSRGVGWFACWRRFCALLTVLFVVRGVFVLSVLPPLEGWDEYQHVAYIVFMEETGRSPVFGEDRIPRSMFEDLVRYPHCDFAIEQVGGIGALTYEAFWKSESPPAVTADPSQPPLYQAQHSALYYRLVAPLYSLLAQRWGFLAAVTGLRLVNVLFGAAAVCLVLWVLGRLVREGSHRYLLGLLIALQPLYLLNCARVANDALALLLGTLAVGVLLLMRPRWYLLGALGAGAALGLAVLAKTVVFGVVPFAVFVFASLAWRRWLSLRRAALGSFVLLAAATAITFSYFAHNIERFGMLTPMQEAVQNKANGKTLADAARTVWDAGWWAALSRRYFRYSLWFGGWSGLQPLAFLKTAYACNLYLAIAGLALLLRASVRRSRSLFEDGVTGWRLGALCLSVAAGLGYHAIQTKMALGTVATNSWYAALSFPWLMCLCFQGWACYPGKWVTRILAAEMVLIYLVAEVHGTLGVMAPAYTGHGWGAVARERLAQLHVAWLGPGVTLPALAVMLAIVGVAMGVCASTKLRGETRQA